jgi:hypothetical protein
VGQAGNLKALATAGMPIWSFYNGRDEYHLAPAAQQMRQTLIEYGVSPLTTEFDRGGHNAWDSAYGPPALYTWLLSQKRTDASRRTKFELLSPATVLATWQRRGDTEWKNADGELSTGEQHSSEPSLLVSPPVVGMGEFHFDVWLERESRCRIAILNAENSTKQSEIMLERLDVGSGGFRGNDGAWLAPLDPVGQRALRVGWNDVRLTRAGNRLLMSLRGYPKSGLAVSSVIAGDCAFLDPERNAAWMRCPASLIAAI